MTENSADFDSDIQAAKRASMMLTSVRRRMEQHPSEFAALEYCRVSRDTMAKVLKNREKIHVVP